MSLDNWGGLRQILGLFETIVVSLNKNWVQFRQLGRVKTKTGSIKTIESSLDNSWAQFRRLHARNSCYY